MENEPTVLNEEVTAEDIESSEVEGVTQTDVTPTPEVAPGAEEVVE